MAKGIICIVLCLWLCLLAVAAALERPELFEEGQKVYESTCIDCHRRSGEGLPDVFPALKQNPFVMGDPTPVIQTILEGRKGKIGTMPSWQNKFSDQQIAAVATFIRNNWGNKAEAVAPEMVAKNRKK